MTHSRSFHRTRAGTDGAGSVLGPGRLEEMGRLQLVWRELASLVNPGHLLGRASPSISTACSWQLFCTGDGVGISNSSASRSSRSSLLCRRLKTRRWSWEVREKGQVGALLSAPGLHWHTHVVTASLARPWPAHSSRLNSLKTPLSGIAFAFTEPQALHLSVKVIGPAPMSHPKFYAYTQNCSSSDWS